MWRHLELAHLIPKDSTESPMGKKRKYSQQSLKETFQITLDQQTFLDKAVIEMIINDSTSFNIVNNSGFQNLMKAAAPSYKLPSRPKLQELLDQQFKEKISDLQELCQATNYISYTADLWKSNANQYYMSIVLHFIDKTWKLHSVLISTTHLKGSHNKDRKGALVKEKIIPFLGPNTKIHSGITDGGEIASVAFTDNSLPISNKFLGKIESRLCICHQLNNIIKKILKLHLETYYIIPWRNFICHLNHSNPFFEFFCECRSQFFGPNCRERLQRDCETRWTSTLVMLAKAEKFKDVVIFMFIKSSNEFKKFIPNFSAEAWNFLTNVNALFSPVLDVIKMLEGDSYPTQNLILFAISLLIDNVRETMNQSLEDLEFLKMALDLEKYLVDIWNSLPQETLIAALVDPRFKSLSHVPETEHEEAWRCLLTEYLSPIFMNKQPCDNSIPEEKELETRESVQFSAVKNFVEKKFKVSNSKIKSEFERYKDLPPIDFNRNPFDWWIENESTYPVIAEIARVYLAIPASQASCERSFSLSKRICTENRTSLKPSNVEKLTILKQNCQTFCELENEQIIGEDEDEEEVKI
jgi:hypothetical protein